MIHIEKAQSHNSKPSNGQGPLLILAGAPAKDSGDYLSHSASDRERRSLTRSGVTFTNKAAEEMMQRVHSLLRPGRSSNPTLSTFHSFCVRVLRRDIPAIGYGRDFTIYDDADQLAVVKSCLKEMGLDEKLLSARYALSRISYAKNHGLTPDRLPASIRRQDGETAVAFGLYEKAEASQCLTCDLPLKTVEI
jgi:DNA helicase-2/ATP-dependent DNA helicase PcrA